jgi:hypothetical protein
VREAVSVAFDEEAVDDTVGFVAWQRTKAGWTDYVAVPAGASPYDHLTR